jgi:hypothetical protein
MALYTERGTDSDGDPNLLSLNRNDDGRWLNAYNGRPDNRWNRENGFVFLAPLLFSFLSRLFVWRVLFCQLSIPATQHFAGLVQWF